MLPFHATEWVWQWLSWGLSRWAFLAALEHMSSLSMLVAVVFYFAGTSDRIRAKHDTAWQVINTAQGKGGSGGRIQALEGLNRDRVALVGVDVSGAFLEGLQLRKAELARANLEGADARNSDFSGAHLEFAALGSANLRHAVLSGADLANAGLNDADLASADLSEADLTGASLDNADLRFANLQRARWRGIRSIENANIFGVKNAPAGFVEWALTRKAIAKPEDD